MKRKRTENAYLAGHQRSWVWGRHAVMEILEAQRWQMRELYLAGELSESDRAAAAEKGLGLGAAVSEVDYERIRALCGAADHQGYLARMGPFPYDSLDALLERKSEAPLYVLLDGLRDPHNFGAILRSAAALGADAVIAGGEGQAPVNNHVVRASAGALNRIPLARADAMAPVLERLREQGVWCVAALPRADLPVWDCDFKQPVAILMGNEAQGLPDDLVARCDAGITIPQLSSLDSLNVAAAAAVVLYEVERQRSGRR
ncbi:MAG: 23S rRNA (guanosine(2251)-2'-O)-methyltransferase RlmB [Candidatus Hydrogenedentes bacterium]|nr:23S rRNA (guanosine(2251)-2'-O)-methyltransferase RlmB [Candidatus Hydrogenedentota bacterium]